MEENKENVKTPDAAVDKSGKEFKAVKQSEKKHLLFGSAFCADKISVYCAFSAVVSGTTVVSAASPVASTAVVTAAVPAS